MFRFDGWLVVVVETSKPPPPPPPPPPLIDSSILVSVLPLEWDGSVVVVVVSFMGLDRLRRNQAADEEEDDVALMEASN